MPDIVSKETRSRMMSSVRAKNTKPEIEIRHRLFSLGLRYRLHTKNLPGTPDVVFPKYGSVVFINGCFWHHHGCRYSALPATRRVWWKKKLLNNAKRDLKVISELRVLGWRIAIIWECAFRGQESKRSKALDSIALRVEAFLKSEKSLLEIPRVARSLGKIPIEER